MQQQKCLFTSNVTLDSFHLECVVGVLQTVQVIVQARLGEKICTRSSSSPTGSDWVKQFSHSCDICCCND